MLRLRSGRKQRIGIRQIHCLFTVLLRATQSRVFCKRLMVTRLSAIVRRSQRHISENSRLNSLLILRPKQFDAYRRSLSPNCALPFSSRPSWNHASLSRAFRNCPSLRLIADAPRQNPVTSSPRGGGYSLLFSNHPPWNHAPSIRVPGHHLCFHLIADDCGPPRISSPHGVHHSPVACSCPPNSVRLSTL